MLRAVRWTRLPFDLAGGPAETRAPAEGVEGFRLECSSCRTIDGYLAVRPIVRNAWPAALDAMIGRLAPPDAGRVVLDRPCALNLAQPPHAAVRKEARGAPAMPALEATDAQRRALADYVATLARRNKEAVR